MKAKTDSGPATSGSTKPDNIENLFLLMQLVSNPEISLKFEKDFENSSIRYADLKNQLADDMVNFIAPIREKAEQIRNEKKYLKEVMEKGEGKARESAKNTLKLVKEVMGLVYY